MNLDTPEPGDGFTCSLAKLLWEIALWLLGPAAGPTSLPVPDALRCRHCHSPRTRMKGLRFHPKGLAPITGYTLRCRICGAENTFQVP